MKKPTKTFTLCSAIAALLAIGIAFLSLTGCDSSGGGSSGGGGGGSSNGGGGSSSGGGGSSSGGSNSAGVAAMDTVAAPTGHRYEYTAAGKVHVIQFFTTQDNADNKFTNPLAATDELAKADLIAMKIYWGDTGASTYKRSNVLAAILEDRVADNGTYYVRGNWWSPSYTMNAVQTAFLPIFGGYNEYLMGQPLLIENMHTRLNILANGNLQTWNGNYTFEHKQ